MGEFVAIALGFPAALLSFSLVIVVLYWVVVLLGGADLDLLDGDVDVAAGPPESDGSAGSDGSGGAAGMLAALGLGGVPVTVALSILIPVAWFVSLVGTSLIVMMPTVVHILLGVGVLVAGLICGWLVTRVLVSPLRRVFRDVPPASRADFVGRMCVIRTGKVTATFGQAEATAEDGSSAVIQVRQHGNEPLTAGSTALIYEYDQDGEFFWVSSYDVALDPDASIRRG